MAYTDLVDGIGRAAFRTTINTNFRVASLVYPTEKSFNLDPIELDGNGCEPLEIINIGNPGFVPQGTETRNLVPCSLLRIGGNVLLTRNLTWDQANLRWATPFQQTDAYGSGMLEMGGEGINMQVSPPADDFYNGNRMVFSFRQSDARGVPGYSTGPVNQAMAPFFMHYATASYQSGKLRSWIPTSATSPLVHLHADELKGTDATADQNEFLRLETNANASTAWPTMLFKKSRGSYETKTVAVTAERTGRIGWAAYDGDEYHTTATIECYTRGTMANNSVGQEMRFLTSSSNTASLSMRMAIANDGAIKFYVPLRYDVSAITTIPDYTANGYDPALSTGTVMQIQPASTTNGGTLVQGFTVSGTNTANALIFRGIQGHTLPTGANTIFVALKHNGSTNFTGIGSGEIGFQFRNNATVLIEILGSGNTGIGVTGATAKLQVRGANNGVSLLVEDDGGNDILSVGESGGALVIGFFGVTPAIRQVVPTGSTADQIITALQNLGLFSQT